MIVFLWHQQGFITRQDRIVDVPQSSLFAEVARPNREDIAIVDEEGTPSLT